MESSEDRVRSSGHIAHWGHEGSASFMQDSKMKLRPKAKTSAASMDPNAANRSNGNVGHSSSCPSPSPRARNPRVLKTDSTLALVLTKSTGADFLRKYRGGHIHGQHHCGWCIHQVREHPLAVVIKATCIWPQKLTRLTASWHFLKTLIVLYHAKTSCPWDSEVALSGFLHEPFMPLKDISFCESNSVGEKCSNILLLLFVMGFFCLFYLFFVFSKKKAALWQYTRNASTSSGCWWGGTAPAPCIAPV